jgi:hypothetical protein
MLNDCKPIQDTRQCKQQALRTNNNESDTFKQVKDSRLLISQNLAQNHTQTALKNKQVMR